MGRELEDSFDFSAWEELLSSGDTPADDTPAATASDVDEELQGQQSNALACRCTLAFSSHLPVMVQASAVIWYMLKTGNKPYLA